MDPTLLSLRDQIRLHEEKGCPLCEGMGMRIIQEDGKQYAVKCECTYPLRALRALERANIPRQYEACTFENFEIEHVPANAPISLALTALQRFVANWGDEDIKKGILLTGDVGLGKTHLAVSTLRGLISEHNAKGLFYDHKALLKAIQNTYNSRSLESELDVLGPVFKADVLVLDELGRENRTEWAGEMIEHILNTRYNDRLTTIITTNYPNLPPHDMKLLNTERSKADHAMQKVTLGDRVGQQVFSRLQEMCIEVQVGEQSSVQVDFRRNVKRAKDFGSLQPRALNRRNPRGKGGELEAGPPTNKYRALSYVHDGLQLHRPGDIMELTLEYAEALLRDGVIEAAKLQGSKF